MNIRKKISITLATCMSFFAGMYAYESYSTDTTRGDESLPIAIYHAFDESFEHVQEKLKELKDLGFSHIQVSPVQQSNWETPENRNMWWNAYQPISYEIGGKYGNTEQFKSLLGAAKNLGLKIIVDVVFNHLGSVYKYSEVTGNEAPQARTAGDWRSAWDNPILLNAYLDQVIQRYRGVGFTKKSHFRDPPKWGFGDEGKEFPTLNLDDAEVRKVQTDFLDRLMDLGVAGFRFDAIGNFGDAWGHFNSHVKAKMGAIDGYFCYGEYASGDASTYSHFQSIGQNNNDFHTMDFVLYYQLGEAFPFGKKLDKLIMPNINGDPWGAVTFADNHDTWANRQTGRLKGGLPGWQGDDVDRALATAFILIRKGGVPLVLNETLNQSKAIVANALNFRARMRKQHATIENVTAINDNTVKIERGDSGFAIINKASEPLSSFHVNLDIYSFLPSDGLFINSEEANTVNIPGRSAVFFYKKDVSTD
jgi:glycosidase